MTRYEVDLTPEQARAWVRDWAVPRLDQPFYQAGHAFADAIRANPPKPPRMAEPGFGATNVTAATPTHHWRRTFVRVDAIYSTWTDGLCNYPWSDLIDPEPYTGDPGE